MKADQVLTIKLTIDEKRYAKALSRRCGGCLRKNEGSYAHGIRWLLRDNAKREGIELNKIEVNTSDNR